MSQSLTQVFYFVPEDGESAKQMNCFIIRKHQDQITLRDVRANFPVPGEYHYRFQYSYQKHGVVVWLDLSSEDSIVPSVDQEIRVKATRLSWYEGQVFDSNKQQLPDNVREKIDQYLQSQNAEKQGAQVDQMSMGNVVNQGRSAMNQGISMLNSFASQTKNALGGVASQVANSMPAGPGQLNPIGNPPQQFTAPQQNQSDFNRQHPGPNPRRSAAPEAQKQQINPTFDDLF